MSGRFDTAPARDSAQHRWDTGRAGLLRRIAAAGRRRMAPGEVASANVFAMLLFALLAIALFLALAGGTTAYQRIVSDDVAARTLRAGTSLIANTVRAVDAADAVETGEGPEGRALVLAEHLDSGTFETRLYLHDGWVVQEYAPAGAAYDPDGAVRMVASETFWFEATPTALRIHCDAGDTVVALRSDGAAADAALQGAADAGATAQGGAADAEATAPGATEGGEQRG